MGIIGTALAVALGLALFYGMRGWISRNGASRVAMTMFGFLLVIGLVAAGGWMLLVTNQQAAQAAESAPAPAAIAQKAAPALAPSPDSESVDARKPTPGQQDDMSVTFSDLTQHTVPTNHVLGIFNGHGSIPPIILTTEPCSLDNHEPGKRAIIGLIAGRVEGCWADFGGSKPIAVCEKKGGDYDGSVMGGLACMDIDKKYFIDPATLPRSAFASR